MSKKKHSLGNSDLEHLAWKCRAAYVVQPARHETYFAAGFFEEKHAKRFAKLVGGEYGPTGGGMAYYRVKVKV